MDINDRRRLFRGVAMAVAALVLVAGGVFASQAGRHDPSNLQVDESSQSAGASDSAEPSESEDVASEVEDAAESEDEASEVEDAAESEDETEASVGENEVDATESDAASPDASSSEDNSGSGSGGEDD